MTHLIGKLDKVKETIKEIPNISVFTNTYDADMYDYISWFGWSLYGGWDDSDDEYDECGSSEPNERIIAERAERIANLTSPDVIDDEITENIYDGYLQDLDNKDRSVWEEWIDVCRTIVEEYVQYSHTDVPSSVVDNLTRLLNDMFNQMRYDGDFANTFENKLISFPCIETRMHPMIVINWCRFVVWLSKKLRFKLLIRTYSPYALEAIELAVRDFSVDDVKYYHVTWDGMLDVDDCDLEMIYRSFAEPFRILEQITGKDEL